MAHYRKKNAPLMGGMAAALLLLFIPWGEVRASDSELVRQDERLAGLEVSEKARAEMDNLVRAARDAGLPEDPLVAKFLEGVAKGVPEARILAAVRAVKARLGRASEILNEAIGLGVRGPVVGQEVARVAAALSAGVHPEQIRMFGHAAVEASVGTAEVAAAAAALERLRAMGNYEASAAHAVAAAISSGQVELALARLIDDYRRHSSIPGEASGFFHGMEGSWHRGGLSGAGLFHDSAGRLEDGRQPDEAGGGPESLVPGTDRLAKEEDARDPYARDRRAPRDLFPVHPGPGHQEPSPEPFEPPDGPETP